MKAILIEDDALWKNKLLIMLDEIGVEVMAVCGTVTEAILQLKKQKPDIIITDIMLQNETTFKIFEANAALYKIPTILITQSEKMMHYKQANLIDKHLYIVKPIHKLTLKSAIENLCSLNTKPEIVKSINLKGVHNEKVQLPISQIYYIEQLSNYCHIHTQTKTFVQKKSLVNIKEELDENFIIIHRKYCINVNAISKYNNSLTSLIIKETELPVGRINRENLKMYLANKLVKQE